MGVLLSSVLTVARGHEPGPQAEADQGPAEIMPAEGKPADGRPAEGRVSRDAERGVLDDETAEDIASLGKEALTGVCTASWGFPAGILRTTGWLMMDGLQRGGGLSSASRPKSNHEERRYVYDCPAKANDSDG